MLSRYRPYRYRKVEQKSRGGRLIKNTFVLSMKIFLEGAKKHFADSYCVYIRQQSHGEDAVTQFIRF